MPNLAIVDGAVVRNKRRGTREKARAPLSTAIEKISRAKARVSMLRKLKALDKANKLEGEERRLAKIKPWLQSREKNEHGYVRVKIRQVGGETVVRVPGKHGARELKVSKEFSFRGKTGHVFFNPSEGRFIFVERSTEHHSNSDWINYLAYSAIPKGNEIMIGRRTLFLKTHRILKPDKRISIGGEFRWEGGQNRPNMEAGETRPPNWIKEQGFGLFVDFLRDVETRRRGIRKVFGAVYEGKKASTFGGRRGFRELSETERNILNETRGARDVFDPKEHTWMVRDL